MMRQQDSLCKAKPSVDGTVPEHFGEQEAQGYCSPERMSQEGLQHCNRENG
jgi:hypothetical protein